ncbi:MAG: hypothetical protein QHC90_25785 [Shinella sp.]|nr:hypothetical protein [Shinella sp.]
MNTEHEKKYGYIEGNLSAVAFTLVGILGSLPREKADQVLALASPERTSPPADRTPGEKGYDDMYLTIKELLHKTRRSIID